MRIHKGNQCLPIRSFLQQQEATTTVIQLEKSCADDALLRLVALAAADNIKYLLLEHVNGAFPEENKHPKDDLENNRVSADDDIDKCSLFHNTDSSPKTESVVIKRMPVDRAMISCRSTSDQSYVLEQSFGSSGHDGVPPDILQGAMELVAGSGRLVAQVATSFRNGFKLVDLEEQGGRITQDSPVDGESKSSIAGDSELNHEEAISSNDMIEAAIQLQNLQNLQKNQSNSGIIKLSNVPSFPGKEQEVLEAFLGRSKLGKYHKSMNRKTSSIADQSDFQCKRDDGKGWRCSRPAEGGYTMCKYHREQICRAQSRRKRIKVNEQPIIAVKTSSPRYVINSRAEPNPIITASDCLPFTDDELAYDERRRFVKVKSLKSLLLSTNVQPTFFDGTLNLVEPESTDVQPPLFDGTSIHVEPESTDVQPPLFDGTTNLVEPESTDDQPTLLDSSSILVEPGSSQEV